MLPEFSFELAVVTGVANGTCITGTESFKLTPKNLKRDTILGEATLEEAILEGKKSQDGEEEKDPEEGCRPYEEKFF